METDRPEAAGRPTKRIFGTAFLRSDVRGIWRLLTNSKTNLLLACVPAGWVTHFIGLSNIATFTLNIVGLVPLAWLLGCTTEDLALRCGPVAGGLINASFGNAPELILSMIALVRGLTTVALASLIGSVLSNLLFVLGSCFFIGGLRQGKGVCLLYDMLYTTNLSSSMLLAAIMLATPSWSAIAQGHSFTDDRHAILVRAVAIILILLYACLLINVLWTHKPTVEDEEADAPCLSLWAAAAVLAIITVLVTVSSEFLIGALKGLIAHSAVSGEFLGLVILPLASNATDHASAVILAFRDKMDLAFGCCLGSAVQVAMLVLPVLVLVGWVSRNELGVGADLSLAIFTLLAAGLVCQVTRLGKSDWLQGLLLLSLYVVIALYYALLPTGPNGLT